MSWSCRRPGCGERASVVISYDTVACEVWVDHLEGAPDSAQLLCDRHRSRLSPPRGWTVLDRTGSPATEMDDVDAVASAELAGAAPTGAGEEPAGRRGWGQTDITPGAEFVGGRAAELPTNPPVVIAPMEEIAQVVESAPVEESGGPVGDLAEEQRPHADNVSDLLEPKGGLLGRAFRSTGHQRSVLTQEPAPE